MVASNKKQVVVVDDSALIRKLLSEIINSSPDFEVVATAADPYIAREQIKKHDPDVITLDVEMPRMDGLTFLENLMRLRPMPVVMISSLTQSGANVTLRALELGAVDFVAKPRADVTGTFSDYAEEIMEKLRLAVKARISRHHSQAETGRLHRPLLPGFGLRTTEKLIAIGASTGGTEAIYEVLRVLPHDSPAIVITQHIPAVFSAAFAQRLDGQCAISVSEAVNGQPIVPGHAYVAPGGRHMTIERSGARWLCRINDDAPVNRHRPSVDVLFRSVARAAGQNALGVILTGMGDDGARGLLEMHEKGAPTIAQDEATSIVWGMPGVAVKLGAADHILPLGRIAETMLNLTKEG